MKKSSICFLLFFLCNYHFSFSQTFKASGGTIVDFQDTDIPTVFPIKVSGLPDKIDTAFGLETICFDITHPSISDLKIELQSPSGLTIWVTNRNGKKGKDYTETCFNENGFNGYIYEAKAPFIGTYIPDGRIYYLNNNQNPNGTWNLLVHDLAKENIGTVNSIRITFGNHPPKPELSPCTFNNPAGCACPDGSTSCDLLPDLIVSLKMSEILHEEYAQNDPVYPHQLRLAVATANIGWGPLEVVGSGQWFCGKKAVPVNERCPDSSFARQLLQQRIYHRSGDSLGFKDISAGKIAFDARPGHMHYHADNWVDFTLRKKNKNPNPLKWPVVGHGTKASFCIYDSGNCTDKNALCADGNKIKGERELKNYGFGKYVECNSDRQGLSVGGLDVYGQSFEGQLIDLPKDLCNGKYFIVVTVDPLNLYKESDETNNSIIIPVEIMLQKKCR